MEIFLRTILVAALVSGVGVQSRAGSSPYAGLQNGLPTISASNISVSTYEYSFQNSQGNSQTNEEAEISFTNFATSEGFTSPKFGVGIARVLNSGQMFVGFRPNGDTNLQNIPGLTSDLYFFIDRSLSTPNLQYDNTQQFKLLPASLQRAILAVIAQLPATLRTANQVSIGTPLAGKTFWDFPTVIATAQEFDRLLFASTSTVQPQIQTAAARLIAGAVFSSARAEAQSFLRFHNTGTAAGTVTVTLLDYASGQKLNQWTSPSIAAGAEQQFDISTIETSGTPSTFTKPSYYAVEIRSSIAGYFQHVLYRPADGTLTNLGTCATGTGADPGKVIGVHSSMLAPSFPSSIVVNNTGHGSAAVRLGIYDARNGLKLGDYTTTSIPSPSQVIVPVDAIEAAIGKPSTGMFHYVVRAEGGLIGFLQHLVNNQKAGVITDMTTVCSIDGTILNKPVSPMRAGAIFSSAQPGSQSFLRFLNAGSNAGQVTVTLRDEGSGAALGSWTSPNISPNSEQQFAISVIENGIAAGSTKPSYYSVDVQSGISGYFQHVLWRAADGTLTNLSTCETGVAADPMRVGGVHSSLLNAGYQSSIVVHNGGGTGAAATLAVYDARDGTPRGTYVANSIAAGGEVIIPITEIEAVIGQPTAGMYHYVVALQGAFPGFIQHLVNNLQAHVTTDMTAACSLVPITGAPVAAIRYVAPTGNDSAAGTADAPLRTIQACASTAGPGDICYVRGGTYRETVNPNSGVTIAAYNGEVATVDGTDPITTWTKYRGSTYVASTTLASDDTNQIFVNGEMMTEARWPNGNDLLHVNWATAQAGTDDTHLVDSNLPDIDWTGAKLHLWSGTDPWDPQTGTITASSSGRLTFAVDGASFEDFIRPMPGGYYYLYRTLGALDAEREWLYDATAKKLYLWAPRGSDPATLDVRAKTRQLAFDLSHKANVTIKNIRIFASTVKTDADSANNVLDGLDARYVSHFTDLPDTAAYRGSSWYAHQFDSGIVLNGYGNRLQNSVVAFSAGNGVTIMGPAMVVMNNLFRETGYMGTYATGITISGPLAVVRNNTVFNTGRFSAQLTNAIMQPDDADISFNNFYNGSLLTRDSGHIYAGGISVKRVRIHHNWLHDSYTVVPGPASAFARSGVYLDEDTSGYEVDQNVIWNNQANNIFLHGSTSGQKNPMNISLHHNSIPDASADGYVWLQDVAYCGTTSVHDNFVLRPVVQSGSFCSVTNNGSAAPGATEMTSEVQVGCSLTGCSSNGPPAIVNGMVAASIAFQPYDISVNLGKTATFTAVGVGSAPLSYQWRRNGAIIAGATAPTYTILATSSIDDGAMFAVTVTNSLGSVTSTDAKLTVE